MDLPVGLLTPGYFADVLVVRGEPAEDVSVLQNTDNLLAIMQTPGRWAATTAERPSCTAARASFRAQGSSAGSATFTPYAPPAAWAMPGRSAAGSKLTLTTVPVRGGQLRADRPAAGPAQRAGAAADH